MGRVSFDLEQIQTIATACQNSGERISDEARVMQSQIQSLYEALQGVPHIGVADDFQHLNTLLSQVSDELAQSNQYLTRVIGKIQEFVTSLGQG